MPSRRDRGWLASRAGRGPAPPIRRHRPRDVPATQCPATLAEANGQACASGLLCPYEFACGAFQQQATCGCTSGTFACAADATDAAAIAGEDAAPNCSPATNPATCPTREPDDLSTCTTGRGSPASTHGVRRRRREDRHLRRARRRARTNGGLGFSCAIAGGCAAPGEDAGSGTPATRARRPRPGERRGRRGP